jgi:pimeloyl-ACP methyl ester carboxylesterase
MIFVTAAQSDNEADVLNRPEPLALLAAHNIMQRYPVDPQQVYVGGFSGGARMALRLARAFPDLFHGALLNASSDPIGNAQIPLPPQELLFQFQESTRIVYAHLALVAGAAGALFRAHGRPRLDLVGPLGLFDQLRAPPQRLCKITASGAASRGCLHQRALNHFCKSIMHNIEPARLPS